MTSSNAWSLTPRRWLLSIRRLQHLRRRQMKCRGQEAYKHRCWTQSCAACPDSSTSLCVIMHRISYWSDPTLTFLFLKSTHRFSPITLSSWLIFGQAQMHTSSIVVYIQAISLSRARRWRAFHIETFASFSVVSVICVPSSDILTTFLCCECNATIFAWATCSRRVQVVRHRVNVWWFDNQLHVSSS